jgi:hypothetical protein
LGGQPPANSLRVGRESLADANAHAHADNIISQLDNMVATKGLGKFKEIVLSGCSAGGMACYLKCDFVSSYFAKHGIPVK